MFDVGIPELILILVVALVVFGPGKLPEIGAALGKSIREFRRATQGISSEIQAVTNSVTNLEPEDEMRTRLITEQNAKAKEQAAAESTPPESTPASSAETNS